MFLTYLLFAAAFGLPPVASAAAVDMPFRAQFSDAHPGTRRDRRGPADRPRRRGHINDLDNHPAPRRNLIAKGELQTQPAPDLALLHWGREFAIGPSARERQLVVWLRDAGAPIVVSAHPHRASRGIELLNGLDAVRLH